MRSVKKGATSVVLYFKMRLLDGTDAPGLTATTFDLQYTRELAAAATKSDGIVGTGGAATYVANKVFEVDATSSPGLYMVCFPDAAFATGANQVICHLLYDATTFTEAQSIELVEFDLSGAEGLLLALSASGMKQFTVGATDLTSTSCSTNLTEVDDIFNNGSIVFLTGNAAGCRASITDFADTNGVIHYSSGTAQIPANGDIGIIV